MKSRIISVNALDAAHEIWPCSIPALVSAQTYKSTENWHLMARKPMFWDHSMDSSKEVEARLLESEESESGYELLHKDRRKSHFSGFRENSLSALFCLVGALCLGSSIAILMINHAWTAQKSTSTVMNQKLKETSFYSPVLDQLDIPLIETKSNGAFFDDPDNSSLFRQLPGPEVDAAWDDLEWIGRFYVTDEEVLKLGKDPSRTVRSPRHPGKHLAIVTVFHELHCLNSLRKALYPEHYFGQKRTDEIYWSHIYHCIDTIRQSLMCSANVDVTTYNWVETQDAPYADLNKNQVCRDFERIKRWQNETMADLNDVPVVRQGGEFEYPRPKKLKQIHEASQSQEAAHSHGT